MAEINQDLSKMTAAASSLGWKLGEFPLTFTTEDHQWTRKEDTIAANGEIQTVGYQDQHGQWLIVFND